jgi:hypothetical protein
VESPAAREAARRLLARELRGSDDPDAVAAGAERVFAQVFRNLAQWVGTAGCHALVTRSLVLTAPQFPILTGVRHMQSAPHLERLAENAREYGGKATIDGVTALLASIITTLNGLIGEDVAMSILDAQSSPAPAIAPAVAIAAASASASDTTQAMAPQTGHGDGAS